mmetsp:Transcript_35543/g.114266  ORF Transcript_35543/g.114266 Transcript_35543/m.114266 type:complete len:353 (+) Transcript_35543:617-1675(+)
MHMHMQWVVCVRRPRVRRSNASTQVAEWETDEQAGHEMTTDGVPSLSGAKRFLFSAPPPARREIHTPVLMRNGARLDARHEVPVPVGRGSFCRDGAGPERRLRLPLGGPAADRRGHGGEGFPLVSLSARLHERLCLPQQRGRRGRARRVELLEQRGEGLGAEVAAHPRRGGSLSRPVHHARARVELRGGGLGDGRVRAVQADQVRPRDETHLGLQHGQRLGGDVWAAELRERCRALPHSMPHRERHRGERRGGVEAQGALRRSKEVVDRHSDQLELARAEGGQVEAAGESDAEDEAGERAGGADGEVDAARVCALARSDLLGELEHRANLPEHTRRGVGSDREDDLSARQLW